MYVLAAVMIVTVALFLAKPLAPPVRDCNVKSVSSSLKHILFKKTKFYQLG